MFKFGKKDDDTVKAKKAHKQRYDWVKKTATPAAPVCVAIFYICIVLTVLMILCSLILVLVNVSVEEMLLPPFMRSVTENGKTTGYNIYVGNGIRMYAPVERVTLGDIKTVYYAGIATLCGVLLTVAPIMKFLSLLLKNIKKDDLFHPKNPKYLEYIGLTVLVGNTVVLFLSRFYNYYLIKLFVSDGSNISLSLGINVTGMLFGLMIIYFSHLYGYICTKNVCAQNNFSDNENLTDITFGNENSGDNGNRN